MLIKHTASLANIRMPPTKNNETVNDLNPKSSSIPKPKRKRFIPRCEEISCEKGAISGYQICKRHGGGKRCKESECPKGAQSSTDYCMTHGGGNDVSKKDVRVVLLLLLIIG